MKKIKYNSEIGTQIDSNLKDAAEVLEDNIKVTSDFSDFISAPLFSSQINNISTAVSKLVESYNSFASTIKSASGSWAEIVYESEKEADEFKERVRTQIKNNGGIRKAAPNIGGNNQNPTQVEDVRKGKEITSEDIKELIAKIDYETLPILLQKMNKLSDTSIVDLLFDENKSNIVTLLLKKILGDPTEGEIPVSLETEDIQKIILEKINKDGLDLTTEEGKEQLRKYLKEQLNVEYDEATWYRKIYGDKTVKMDLSNYSGVGGTWIIAKTTQDLKKYNNYILSYGIKQDANPKEWGDACLSFANTYAYDLYYGQNTRGNAAATYSVGSFSAFIDNDKQVVLSKIYDEIINGRPVVLQVNGNKEGTSRHFVTVVGFKEGVISGATLKETDLLIIDSWDGKLERMDTAKSRFMTTGTQCGKKDYTGYRLQVFRKG